MVEAEAAGNLVVVRTHPGNASPVARSLDTIGWKEIVGTVAGDDTILIVTANAATARLIKQRLLALGRLGCESGCGILPQVCRLEACYHNVGCRLLSACGVRRLACTVPESTNRQARTCCRCHFRGWHFPGDGS